MATEAESLKLIVKLFKEGETLVGFGKKMKGNTYTYVWETDPSYINWLRNIEPKHMKALLFQQWVQRMDMIFKDPHAAKYLTDPTRY